jgi:hypothetical protein
VHCLARDDREPPVSRPWPVSPGELRGFIQAGLREDQLADQPGTGAHGRFFTAIYARASLNT